MLLKQHTLLFLVIERLFAGIDHPVMFHSERFFDMLFCIYEYHNCILFTGLFTLLSMLKQRKTCQRGTLVLIVNLPMYALGQLQVCSPFSIRQVKLEKCHLTQVFDS